MTVNLSGPAVLFSLEEAGRVTVWNIHSWIFHTEDQCRICGGKRGKYGRLKMRSGELYLQ